MNILNLPYFAGGLSHLLPLYVLHHKYIKHQFGVKNYFLVNNNWQHFLSMQGIDSVPIDFFDSEVPQQLSNDYVEAISYVIAKQQEAYDKVKPALIIEDTAFCSPLIAEKNGVPRISIQRTGMFRSIDERYRNHTHVHSMQKGDNIDRSDFFSSANATKVATFSDEDSRYLEKYIEPKAKIIPGIPTIERLPEDVADRDSYFYAGPLIVKDKPSKSLTDRLDEFLMVNKQKRIVFITTGTVDKTPIEKYIEFFVKRNYAVITTCDCEINQVYPKDIFYNKLLPLHHICKISNLVIHQCGSGMYHYPIMNRAPFLTLGTQCFDREDIAQRLQELGVSGHIPHPDDDPDHWHIFVELVNRFENNTLTDYDMMDKLRKEINETMANFNMAEVIQYALV
jgi:hypothetical protein